MLLKLLRSFFVPTVETEASMVTVVYKVRVVTADGTADLEMEKHREMFVPSEGDGVHVTTCVLLPENDKIVAVVQDVEYNPSDEIVIVSADTHLDLREGYKIECLVASAVEDGWDQVGDIDYHGCCKGLCPCDVAGETVLECDPKTCKKPECNDGTCERKAA